jgi:hypothetical protein
MIFSKRSICIRLFDERRVRDFAGLRRRAFLTRLPAETRMILSRHYTKNIVCLESLWDAELENRLSELPVLELTARTMGVKFIYLTCNTKRELRHNLRLVGSSKRKAYGILMLAFHGEPGSIELAGDSNLNLEGLITMMGRRFAGWVVHFASCGTVNVEKQRLQRFVEATGVAMVMGYTKEVDWTEGTVMDLLLLRWLQNYKNLHSLLKHLKKHYPDLIKITGFKVYPPT